MKKEYNMNGVWSEFAEEGLMIPKAPKVKYEVFLVNFGYVCGAAATLKEAKKIAKKTGFQCSIFKSTEPFKPIAWVSPVG